MLDVLTLLFQYIYMQHKPAGPFNEGFNAGIHRFSKHL